MDDGELLAHLQQLVQGYSLNREDGELSSRRKRLQRYHDGELYGTADETKPGRSRVVTREVLQTVRWSLPRVVRSCLTGRPVSFQPTSGEDVEAAEQETDAALWAIRAAPNAFGELWSFAYSTLLMPNAYLKVWWDDTPEYDIGEIEGKEQIEIAMVDADSNAELLDVRQREDGLFDATVRYAYTTPQLRYESIPEEEMLIAANATHLDLDKVPWLAHRPTTMTDGDLIAMGIDEDVVASIPSSDIWMWQSERQNRANTEDETRVPQQPLAGMEYKEVYDWWGFVDFDGDGYAERRHVMYGGSEVLLNEYADHQPFVAAASLPQPHRHVGMSQAEPAMPWQRVSSELARQGLNNIYRINARRNAISRDANVDTDQFASAVQDGWYEVDGDPARAVAPEIVPVMYQHVLAGQDWVAQQLAAETGVSKTVTGADAAAMAGSTMGAYLEASGQASEVLELVVRCFAESGMAGLMRKAHHILRTRETGEMMAEVNGQYMPVAPSSWAKRTTMVALVGSGTGAPREKISALMATLDLQREALSAGLATPSRIYNTLEDLMAQMGRGTAARYFLDPDSEEAQAMAQAKAEADRVAQEQAQMQAQQLAQFTEAQLMNEMAKRSIDREKAAGDIIEARDKSAQAWTELELENKVDIEGVGINEPAYPRVVRDR